MKTRSNVPVRLGAAALVTSCLVIAAVAYVAVAASADGAYSGRTSQRRAISFHIASGSVRSLRYRINDRCPGSKPLVVRAWGFPPLRIRHHHFGGTFTAQAPASAKAVIHGTVSGTTVTGTRSDRTQSRTSHRVCAGKATFSLTRHRTSHPRNA